MKENGHQSRVKVILALLRRRLRVSSNNVLHSSCLIEKQEWSQTRLSDLNESILNLCKNAAAQVQQPG